MTKHCINHARVTYDCCRHCLGKDLDCPEYLSQVEYTRKSPRVEKLVEIPDYEPSNGVRGKQTDSQTVPDIGTHSESYSRPVQYRRLSIMESRLTTRYFLSKFYRSQR
jgi:hypothetical protein